jgi:hypothetical protein
MELLKTTQFNYTEKEASLGVKPDIRIYVPHAATVDEFRRIYPSLYNKVIQACPTSEEDLINFWVLESDIFAYEFAMIVAQKVRDILHPTLKPKIEVVSSTLLRGLVDVNRKIKFSLWNIFDFDEYPDLVQELNFLHQMTVRKVLDLMTGTKIGREIHTLSPINPTHDVIVRPDNVLERLDSYSRTDGERANNDIVCKLQGTNEINVGDKVSILNMKRIFDQFGIKLGFSEKFHAGPEYISPVIAKEVEDVGGSYVISDFTKDNGSKEKPGDEDFCLWNLTFEKVGLDKITVPYAMALVDDYLRLVRNNQ